MRAGIRDGSRRAISTLFAHYGTSAERRSGESLVQAFHNSQDGMLEAANTNHMKINSKIAVAAIAACITGSAFAGQDLVLKRVDHPNGQPTFLYVPDSGSLLQSVGVYNEGRSFDTSRDESRYDNGRPQKIHRGRGDNIPVGRQ